jgi:hypothetical protein
MGGSMTAPAAFQACFSDFRLIKGRKVAQLIFELPIEGCDAALEAMGGVPQPHEERWAAIARIDLKAAVSHPKREEEVAPRRPFDELPLPQQAALRCQDLDFRRFLRTEKNGESVNDLASAAEFVRDYCDIGSRAELAVSDKAARDWVRLDGEYRAWMERAA